MTRSRMRCLLVAGLALGAHGAMTGADHRERSPDLPPLLGFVEEEVRFATAAPGIELAGTLTVPDGNGPFPGAVLLKVAGPADRDQSLAGHRGLAVLAHHLARRGIASLRTDDRGVGGSGGIWYRTSYEEMTADALSTLERLGAHPRVDLAATGFIGMSEGAAIAALAAGQGAGAFIALLGAPGIRGEEALRGQFDQALARSGIEGERREELVVAMERFLDAAKAPADDPEGDAAMREVLAAYGDLLIPPYGFMPPDLDGRVALFRGPWYRSQLLYNPAATLGRLEVPVLALTGDKDMVAPAAVHLPAIEAHLAASPSPDVTVAVMPELNHLFQTARTGHPSEYAELEESFAGAALERISAWIEERFGPKAPGLSPSLTPTHRR